MNQSSSSRMRDVNQWKSGTKLFLKILRDRRIPVIVSGLKNTDQENHRESFNFVDLDSCAGRCAVNHYIDVATTVNYFSDQCFSTSKLYTVPGNVHRRKVCSILFTHKILIKCISLVLHPVVQQYFYWLPVYIAVSIGVNFYKAARLEPPPLFKLLGFRASEPPSPHFFVTCNAYYEAVFCGLPNNKMTPNDIHANQTTSFVRIQQWKLQAVSRMCWNFSALAVV